MNYNFLKTLCIITIFIPSFLTAQKDSFSNFKTTQSVGEPPTIFTTSFKDKVAERVESSKDIEKNDREQYALYTNYSVNSLLNSGHILYGDPMTKFVNKVADKLLENEPGLKRKLQFYVIKTNTTNALCTDPGIIFITTGLLSQIENEAQLAYVISHEIVHYQEKHLQKSFKKSKEQELEPTSSYEDMVLLSKDHEFEADANALKFYHAAGYSDKEVNVVFDVLMYSYLSFDEINIDSTFFAKNDAFIPQSYFPEAANPILAFEDYDDSKSSHPNIRKRRDAISEEIKKYDNWKANSNFIALEEFKHVQNIARFESIRENILVGNYLKALYEIYILEKTFPNNEYLQTSKALTWATMNQISVGRSLRSVVKDDDEIEGQLSLLYGFFKKLNKEEMALLTIRIVQDVCLEFPASERLKEIKKESIENLAHVRNFKFEELKSKSYTQANLDFELSLNDTIADIDTIVPENESKYDRIKRIREEQVISVNESHLEEQFFSLFLLHDLVNDEEFKKTIEEEKEKLVLSRTSSYKKSNSDDDNKLIGDIILITPKLKAKKNGDFDLESTLLFYEYLKGGVDRHAPKERLKLRDNLEVEDFTTEKHNEVSILISYIIQFSNSKNKDFKNLLVDYEEMKSIIAKYDNPQLLLISGDYYYNKLTDKAISGNASYIELKTGNIYSTRNYISKYKLNKISVEGFTHLIFNQLK
ncbi:M48 family metallopeptidase [Brumimicrobium mesophilum]|uniref:M48 family metallopeptidase n=1 Tax=Brumimicrobium mesophilum TaxID=392717 RepID=UPI00131D2021|nr:M48 family metallopeptidase [Brumimicrobium mesophilum]